MFLWDIEIKHWAKIGQTGVASEKGYISHCC